MARNGSARIASAKTARSCRPSRTEVTSCAATATADEDATGRSADSRIPKEAHSTQTPVAASTVRIAPVRCRTNESPEPSDGQGREHEQAQEEPHGPDHGEDRRRRAGRGPDQVLGGPRVVPVDEWVERAVQHREEGGVEDPDDEEQPEDHPDDDGEPPCGHTAQARGGRRRGRCPRRAPGPA